MSEPEANGVQDRDGRTASSPLSAEQTMHEPGDRPDPETLGNSLRAELKVGVRMMKALELQLDRAERILRLEADATQRADETVERLQREMRHLDGSASDPLAGTGNHESIMHRLEGLARDLGARLDSQAVRLAEIDATVTTLERRIDRMNDDSSSTSSGSLSLATPVSSPGHVSGELRDELEGIRRASASLAEAVEAADRTDAALRRTLDAATSRMATGSQDARTPTTWSLTTILRRLADEFDAAAAAGAAATVTTPTSTATVPKPSSGIEVERPLMMDLTGESDADLRADEDEKVSSRGGV